MTLIYNAGSTDPFATATFSSSKPSNPVDGAIWCDTSDYSFWVYISSKDSWLSFAEMSFSAGKFGVCSGNHYMDLSGITLNSGNLWYFDRDVTICRFAIASKNSVVPGSGHAGEIWKKIGAAAIQVLYSLNFNGLDWKESARDLDLDVESTTGLTLRYNYTAAGTPAENPKMTFWYRWRLDG